ncbi:hypothetical protein BH11ACT8_BH11ACT8_04370 [soil metagenome]
MPEPAENADDRTLNLLIASAIVSAYVEVMEHLDAAGLLVVQEWLFEPSTRQHMAHQGFAEMHLLADQLLAVLLAEKSAEETGGGGADR